MQQQDIPIIDGNLYINQAPGWEDECKKVAASFHIFGIVKMKDPRVTFKDNDDYINMVERYFDQVSKRYYAGEELKDCKPQYFYQTGVTPEGQERARNHQALIDSLSGEDKPLTQQPPDFDAKWRFFWKIGERPEELQDEIPQTYPENFPEWEHDMNRWGH